MGMNHWQALQVIANLRKRLADQKEYANKEAAKNEAHYLRDEIAQREAEIDAIDYIVTQSLERH
jgi:hypothetical protein